MAISAKYAGKCKDCGTAHQVGDMIDKNGNESPNKDGVTKAHWCKNGVNCQGVMKLETTEAPPKRNLVQIHTEPTPDELLATARELNKQDKDKMPEEIINKVYNNAAHEAIVQLVRQAAINNIMDKAGIKHPSRVAFTHEVMENLR